jgi:hypothetical protein
MARRRVLDERLDAGKVRGTEVITVACVLNSGGIYDAEHVARLRAQVAAHLTRPHRFVCLSDVDVPCERIALIHGWRGWWAKIELFRPGLFDGRVLYLDLDVTVVGSLDEIADFPAPFAAIPDYENPAILNSSVMVWDAGAADRAYTDFRPAVIEQPGGDQAWISACLPKAAHLPRGWCPSFKHDCRFSVPKGAKVVVYHGRPKPWDSKKELVFA